jgi:hypothetical protein
MCLRPQRIRLKLRNPERSAGFASFKPELACGRKIFEKRADKVSRRQALYDATAPVAVRDLARRKIAKAAARGVLWSGVMQEQGRWAFGVR